MTLNWPPALSAHLNGTSTVGERVLGACRIGEDPLSASIPQSVELQCWIWA
jgi:hypothetical protein